MQRVLNNMLRICQHLKWVPVWGVDEAQSKLALVKSRQNELQPLTQFVSMGIEK